ncbi:MAG: PKD domain-containing protein [Chitinophagaceae bacterium]|nr:PKD domain-containing protein [Chitinophagaceae bacterium]
MRNLYALMTAVIFWLTTQPLRSQNVTPDTADFTFTVNHETKHVVFTNTSRLGNGHGIRFALWSFGNGQTAVTGPLQGTEHTYQMPGTYTVCLRIFRIRNLPNPDTTLTSIKCKTVVINTICRADFERIPGAPSPLTVVFKALPWHNGNFKPSRICWQFGDGRDTCIYYTNAYTGNYTVTHTYSQPGNYQVCISIRYFDNCEAQKCKPIVVIRPDSCRADFERLNVPVPTPLSVSLKALPWHNNNKRPEKICWQFGDGRDTCILYPVNYTGNYTVTHTYAQPGNYNVCVKIWYVGGCVAQKCKPVSVPNPPNQCGVNLWVIATNPNNLQRTFIAIRDSVSQASPVGICWYFGDGTDTCIMITQPQPSPVYTITHTYPAPGSYRACVKMIYNNGCIAVNCKDVNIGSNTNLCGGYMTDSVIGPRTFRFKGFGIHRPDDAVIRYFWTFGDGTTATGQTVTHTYQQTGNYEVCLFIKTQKNCDVKICKPLRVQGQGQPQLAITPNPVTNFMQVVFQSTHTETVQLKILNNNGIVVRDYVRNAITGTNIWNFDVSSLAPGVYTLVVVSPNQFASAVFIKQ